MSKYLVMHSRTHLCYRSGRPAAATTKDGNQHAAAPPDIATNRRMSSCGKGRVLAESVSTELGRQVLGQSQIEMNRERVQGGEDTGLCVLGGNKEAIRVTSPDRPVVPIQVTFGSGGSDTPELRRETGLLTPHCETTGEVGRSV